MPHPPSVKDAVTRASVAYLEARYTDHLRDQVLLAASHAPIALDARDRAEELAGEGPSDDAIAMWENEGIARAIADVEERAAHDAEGEAVENYPAYNPVERTSSHYDFDETGREYSVSFGKSDKGFHYALSDVNS